MNQSANGLTRSNHSSKIVKKDNSIEIPSTLDFLPKVDQFIEKKLKKLKIPKDQLIDIAISVSEAVTNAVVHGNKNDVSKKVRVSLIKNPVAVEIWVEDEGGGFDPTGVASCVENENLLKHTGRGILILNALMDVLEFDCNPDRGTKLKMIKYIK
ncbi:MAG TPA: ATP-binding protein [candidate division Zixibacteria bacterium]